MRLEEVVKWPEYTAIQEQYGKEADDILAAHKNTGFIDPFYRTLPTHRREELYECLRKIPLQEVLGAGTGSDYMSYLIPTKVYQVILDSYHEENILDKISALTIPEFEGSSIYVNWELKGVMRPRWGAQPGGATKKSTKVNHVQITPEDFSMDLPITKQQIRDSVGAVLEFSIKSAGAECADFVVAEALKAMYAGRDSGNNEAGGSNVIATQDVINARAFVSSQGGNPDTIVCCRDQYDDIIGDTTTFNLSLPFKERMAVGWSLDGFLGLNWYPRYVHTDNGLCDPADLADYYALVFDAKQSLAVAWKQPLVIDNYTSPREGLAGAVLSGCVGYGVLHDGDYISAILET